MFFDAVQTQRLKIHVASAAVYIIWQLKTKINSFCWWILPTACEGAEGLTVRSSI